MLFRSVEGLDLAELGFGGLDPEATGRPSYHPPILLKLEAAMERPEQKKTAHDLSDVFNQSNAVPSSEALTNQTDHGTMPGFDFYRDGLGATRPGMTFDDFYRAGVANKAG